MKLANGITDTGEKFWLYPSSVFDGTQLHSKIALNVQHDAIQDLTPVNDVPQNAKLIPLKGVVAPGFFDIQINGGGDVLFNAEPNTNGAQHIAAAHRDFGTTHSLPTVITDTQDVLELACDAIANCAGSHGIVGIHIEGPHISKARAGTHNRAYVRDFHTSTYNALRALRDKKIPTLITLAPEATLPGQVAALVEMGVVVSIGHSDTNAAQANQIIQEGAMLFTHLFNAMSPMQSREPGVVGAGINSEVYCSIICDGKHVAPEMIKLAMNARPRPDRMIIVSDAMPTVGGKTSFELYGETITVHDNALVNANGSLAGAHTNIADSIHYLMQTLNLPLENCLQMAITHPARLMDVEPLFSLHNRNLYNCILINEDGSCVQLLKEVLADNIER